MNSVAIPGNALKMKYSYFIKSKLYVGKVAFFLLSSYLDGSQFKTKLMVK